MGPGLRSIALVLAAALLGGLPPASFAGETVAGDVAIIVNAANTAADISLGDLQAILKLEKQFWSDGKRVVLLLPASGSPAKNLLLKKVYHRTDVQIRQDFARRLFAGDIPAVPTTLRSVEAQIAAVTHSAGAITAVPSGTVLPANVRILTVDGKRPGEPGYGLSDAP